jgi:hypothetical protein
LTALAKEEFATFSHSLDNVTHPVLFSFFTNRLADEAYPVLQRTLKACLIIILRGQRRTEKINGYIK